VVRTLLDYNVPTHTAIQGGAQILGSPCKPCASCPTGVSRAEDKPAPAPESPPQVSEGPSAAQLHHAAEAMAAGAGFTEADMAALKAMMSDLKGAAAMVEHSAGAFDISAISYPDMCSTGTEFDNSQSSAPPSHGRHTSYATFLLAMQWPMCSVANICLLAGLCMA